LPSVDQVLRTPAAVLGIERFGRTAVVEAIRATLASARASGHVAAMDEVAAGALARLEALAQPSLRPVFNLTGTVLHTNLGRALIAEAAIDAAGAGLGVVAPRGSMRRWRPCARPSRWNSTSRGGGAGSVMIMSASCCAS